jgi:hypothetical protein
LLVCPKLPASVQGLPIVIENLPAARRIQR